MRSLRGPKGRGLEDLWRSTRVETVEILLKTADDGDCRLAHGWYGVVRPQAWYAWMPHVHR
jgi:hypothetical protein